VSFDALSCAAVGDCVAGGNYLTTGGEFAGLIEAIPTFSVSTSSLPTGTQGDSYSAMLSAAGGSGGASWSLASGSLPSGLTLSSGGVISGTPTAEGDFLFTAQAVDSGYPAQTAQESFSLSVAGSSTAAITPATPTPPVGQSPAATVTPKTKTLTSSGKGISLAITCRNANCSGTVRLVHLSVHKEKKGKKTVSITKTEVLASTHVSLTMNKSKTVKMKLSAAGKTTLLHAKSHPVRETLEVVIAGHDERYSVTVK